LAWTLDWLAGGGVARGAPVVLNVDLAPTRRAFAIGIDCADNVAR